MKKIDSNTWCSAEFPCGAILADILNEHGNEKLVTKVGNILSNYSKRNKALHNLVDEKKFHLTLLLHFTQNVVKNSQLPLNVETHLMNLITGKFRKELKNI